MLKKTMTLLLAFVLLFAFCGSAMAAEERNEKGADRLYYLAVKLVWVDLDKPTFSVYRQYYEYLSFPNPENCPPAWNFPYDHLTTVDNVEIDHDHFYHYEGGQLQFVLKTYLYYGHGMHDVSSWPTLKTAIELRESINLPQEIEGR